MRCYTELHQLFGGTFMHRKFLALSGAAVCALSVPALAAPAADTSLPQGVPVSQLVQDVNIPFTQFRLDNGLKVVVHTDKKAPVVALSVWYHVGSKDEPAGRTGFAHLFEHLMFGGSEHSDVSWFQPMQAIGATDLNGTTYYDRTNYFETVPRAALDTALFLESDRMGHLLPAITQSKLDIQRGVVQNEKRGDDNQPGGLLQYSIQQTLFPEGNPYHHTVIGSMGDLDQASLEVVKDWFRSHYGPNNAVLVLAGDITPEEAKPLVQKYFGDIPRGPQSIPAAAAVPTLPAPVSKEFHDEVANTTVTRMWAVPGVTDKDTPAIDMAASVLGGLASSRLDNELVRDKKTAVSVSASNEPFERVGEFTISAVVKPGIDPAVVGQQIDAIVADFIKNGPSADELRRAKTDDVSNTIHGLESVGGFAGKAVTLAEGATYAGDPGFYKKELAAEAALTPADVQQAAQKWLSRPAFSFTLAPGARSAYEESKVAGDTAASAGAVTTATPTPADKAASTTPGVDRSHLPTVGTIANLDFPTIEHAKLSNGIPVEFARRNAVPIVRVAVDFNAGNAADPKDKLGTQSFMLSLLDEGTDRYNSVQIAEAKENLGAADRCRAIDGPDRRLSVGADAQSCAVAGPAGRYRAPSRVPPGRCRPRPRAAARRDRGRNQAAGRARAQDAAAAALRQGASLWRSVPRHRRTRRGRVTDAGRPHQLPRHLAAPRRRDDLRRRRHHAGADHAAAGAGQLGGPRFGSGVLVP